MPSLVLTSDTLSVRLLSKRLEVIRQDHKTPGEPPVRTEVPLFDLDYGTKAGVARSRIEPQNDEY